LALVANIALTLSDWRQTNTRNREIKHVRDSVRLGGMNMRLKSLYHIQTLDLPSTSLTPCNGLQILS